MSILATIVRKTISKCSCQPKCIDAFFVIFAGRKIVKAKNRVCSI